MAEESAQLSSDRGGRIPGFPGATTTPPTPVDIVRETFETAGVPKMAIDNAGVVGFISIDPATDKVVLTIADHLEWDENTDERNRLLREKLNTYVEFIESGGLLEKYPKAKGREVIVNVVGNYPLNEEASEASSAIERMGAKLRFQLGASSEDDDAS